MVIIKGGPSGNAITLGTHLNPDVEHDGGNERLALESTIGDCSPETFVADMRRTRAVYGKERLAVETYHYIASWALEEFDPTDDDQIVLAHEWANEWAGKAFPGRQIKFLTKADGHGGQVHTHFHVANVAALPAVIEWIDGSGVVHRQTYDAGRAIDGRLNNIYRLRAITNQIVHERLGYDNNLFITSRQRPSDRVTAADVHHRAAGAYNWRDDFRDKLSEARALAIDIEDYKARLGVAGVTVTERGAEKNFSYTFTDAADKTRHARSTGRSGLGADYIRSSVEEQCEINRTRVAAGDTLEAPDRSNAALPRSAPTTPVYYGHDGELTPGDPPGSIPRWMLERDAEMALYVAKVEANGGTVEGQARRRIDETLDDPDVVNFAALVTVATKYGVSIEYIDEELVVRLTTGKVSGFAFNAKHLGEDYTEPELQALVVAMAAACDENTASEDRAALRKRLRAERRDRSKQI